jgi:hypothetical protein
MALSSYHLMNLGSEVSEVEIVPYLTYNLTTIMTGISVLRRWEMDSDYLSTKTAMVIFTHLLD